MLARTTIQVDSDQKINASDPHENFTYKFFDLKDYDYVTVTQVSIPKSFYNVGSGENTLTLLENIGVSATITVPEGSYSYRNFATVLAGLLTAGSPNGRTYTVTLPSSSVGQTGKYTITISSGSFTISFPSSSYLYKHMGFISGSSNASDGTSLTSVNVCNFADVPCIFVCSDICDTSLSPFNNNVLCAVMVANVPDYGNVVWQNTNSELTAKRINHGKGNYKFTLFDADNNIIGLNGVSWNLELCFFSRSKTLNMLEEYIKYQMMKDNLDNIAKANGSITQEIQKS